MKRKYDTGSTLSEAQNSIVLVEVLDEISRQHFDDKKIINLEQLCCTLEEAYWDYKDLYALENSQIFPMCSFPQFAELLFAGRGNHPPFSNFKSSPQEMVKWYLKFKNTLQSFGAILLDPTLKECVMVRGCNSTRWGFPRGKAKFIPVTQGGTILENKKETALETAVREVYEELGIDISSLVEEDQCIQVTLGRRKVVLFVIPYISKLTPLAPQLRNEIEEISWKKIDELSNLHQDYATLVRYLQQWIKEHKPTIAQKKKIEELKNLEDSEINNKSNEKKDKSKKDVNDAADPEISPIQQLTETTENLRKIKEGWKRCPLCSKWFSPQNKNDMVQHMIDCAEKQKQSSSDEENNNSRGSSRSYHQNKRQKFNHKNNNNNNKFRDRFNNRNSPNNYERDRDRDRDQSNYNNFNQSQQHLQQQNIYQQQQQQQQQQQYQNFNYQDQNNIYLNQDQNLNFDPNLGFQQDLYPNNNNNYDNNYDNNFQQQQIPQNDYLNLSPDLSYQGSPYPSSVQQPPPTNLLLSALQQMTSIANSNYIPQNNYSSLPMNPIYPPQPTLSPQFNSSLPPPPSNDLYGLNMFNNNNNNNNSVNNNNFNGNMYSPPPPPVNVGSEGNISQTRKLILDQLKSTLAAGTRKR